MQGRIIRQTGRVGHRLFSWGVRGEAGTGHRPSGLRREEIGWLAIESSSGTLGTRLFEATFARGTYPDTLNFQANFSYVPLVFANIYSRERI